VHITVGRGTLIAVMQFTALSPERPAPGGLRVG